MKMVYVLKQVVGKGGHLPCTKFLCIAVKVHTRVLEVLMGKVQVLAYGVHVHSLWLL